MPIPDPLMDDMCRAQFHTPHVKIASGEFAVALPSSSKATRNRPDMTLLLAQRISTCTKPSEAGGHRIEKESS